MTFNALHLLHTTRSAGYGRALAGPASRLVALVVVLAAGALLGSSLRSPEGPAPAAPTTLQGNFEYGQGAITIGCAFGRQLSSEPFSEDNPDSGFLELSAVGTRNKGIRFTAILDGPNGLTALVGNSCAVSIDWSQFQTPEELASDALR